MPRYFFNLYNDVTTRDEEGMELPDMAAAHLHGLMETRTMVAQSALDGHIDLNHRVDIVDESGTVLKTIRFADALKIKELEAG